MLDDRMLRVGVQLRLGVQSEDGTVVIRCDGELDLSVVAALREAIEWSYTPGLKVMCIDARGLSFIDSTGLGCLIDASQACEAIGAVLEVLPSEQVANLFELTGMQHLAAHLRVADFQPTGTRHPAAQLRVAEAT